MSNSRVSRTAPQSATISGQWFGRLELLLNPPHAAKNHYTLPLLVGGSRAYDPQASGWFRVRYKDYLPRETEKPSSNPNEPPRRVSGAPPSIPHADVLDVGEIRVNRDSARPTPYMIINHFIAAAGVKGRCTDDPSKSDDIRCYEAQDLAGAGFLMEYRRNPNITPEKAKKNACQKWFGNVNGTGAPTPPEASDKLSLCTMVQLDRFFDFKNKAPVYTFEEAQQRCREAGGQIFDGCQIPPPPEK